MNEKKKIIVLLSVVLFIILLVVVGSVLENSKSKKYLNQFYSDFNGTEDKLVLIGRSGCSWCQLYQPVLDFWADYYEFDYTYVDTDELTSSVFNKLLKDINIDGDDFGTPLTLVVKEGQVVDSINGYVDETKLFEFLKEYDFVDDSEELLVNYISYDEYEELLESEDAEVLVIGQTTCSYCIKAKPILNQIVVDEDVEINYLNITDLSEEDINEFSTSLEYLETNDWGTPLTLIVSEGEIIDAANGLLDYEGYVKLFKENGILE